MKVCSNCGRTVSNNEQICPYCGARSVTLLEDRGSEIVKPPAKRSLALIITLSVLVGLLAVAVVCFVIQMGKDEYPEDTFQAEENEIADSESFAEEQDSDVYKVEKKRILCRVVKCQENITMRDASSITADAIISIPLGAEVEYIEESVNGFYKVKYGEMYGYCLSSYLSFPQGEISTDEHQTTLEVVNCNEYITLRSVPLTSGEEFARIPLGASVTYICTAENGFYCVEYKGQRGFALQKYLAF